MAKNGKNRSVRRIYVKAKRGASKNKLTIARVGAWAIFGIPQVSTAYNAYKQGWGIEGIGDQLLQNFTGYSYVNQKFYWSNLARGYVPLVGAVIFRRVVGRYMR